MTDPNAHRPYFELPVEARTLLTIFARAATFRFGVRPLRDAELEPWLANVWNSKRLTPSSLANPTRLTLLIKEHMSSSYLCEAPRAAVSPDKDVT